jgi:hypothetical protein
MDRTKRQFILNPWLVILEARCVLIRVRDDFLY